MFTSPCFDSFVDNFFIIHLMVLSSDPVSFILPAEGRIRHASAHSGTQETKYSDSTR